MTTRFYAFYTYSVGNERRREEFDRAEDVLELVRKANEPDSPYLGLVVIAGQKLEFEPYEKITAWRVKQDEGS